MTMVDTSRSRTFVRGAMRCAAGVAAASILARNPAAAQQISDTPAALQEVVVTATKVGELQLSQVPMAIQAFTGDALKTMGIRDAKDLMELIPGASEQSEIGAGYKIFSFRGSGAGGPVGDGMIGYYLDDTPFGIPNFQSAPPVQFFDLERVEVLRGPQGTLYGSGSMGGVIIYHTRNHSLSRFMIDGEVESSKTADAGQLNYRTSAAVSMTLVPGQLALRLSGGYDYRAGYADVYQGAPVGTPYKTNANDIHSSAAQAILLWQPVEDLTLRLRAWQFQTNQDYLQVMNSVSPPYLAYQGTVNGYDRRKNNYYSNTVTWKLSDVLLTNATSYQQSLPGGFGVALNLVYELRLSSAGNGPFHWVAGTFYQNATGVYFYDINFPTLAITGGTTTRTRNASVFGEVSYDLFGGKLVPLIGLRYFEDHRSADSQSSGVPAYSSAKPTAVTWRENLAYHVTDNWVLFINAG